VEIDYLVVGGRQADVSDKSAASSGGQAPTAVLQNSNARARSVVLLFDDLSFRPEPSRSLGLSFERLVPLLGDADLVGLTTTSGLGPSVTPTTERAAIRMALTRLAGRREDVAAPFFVGIDEVAGPESRGGTSAMVRRECEAAAMSGEACSSLVMAAARRESSETVRRTENQFQSIRAIVAWMGELPEPRIVILLTDGIAASVGQNLPEQLQAVSEAAATAAVQLFALTGVADGADASDRTFERRQARVSESRFLNRGAQTVAESAGGSAFLVVGQPDRFLQRIVRETSAIYRLAVQISPPSAADSAFVDVKVKVKRRGAVVRVTPRVAR
jgi:hypothetical protein